ncbi:hypothetical protein P3X46_011645 [Hevea brasiliensis]|uniref:NADP-dependent oxidoreductase domain-containing protein n=1 Tax=Hevea brasiliensis TaxID=3981 RepID=A0ABQ9MBR2_HEVBR|nr:hypothetical protein P3X46_011645 [Hevea brasiliensis]
MAQALEMPKVSLTYSSGQREMPVLGMGTAADPFDEAATKTAILGAINLGYRHFDTALPYRSEKPLGEAISEALARGLIGSREELFITSKLWIADNHGNLVITALKNSLSCKPGRSSFPIPKDELLPMDFKSVWAAMEECQRLGLTKTIGVCNFSCKKLNDLLALAKIPPSVNQVEMSPVWQQKKLRELCKAKGIVLTAYSPLGAKGTRWGTNAVMDNEVLNEIAKAHGKTVAQVKYLIPNQGTNIWNEKFTGNIDVGYALISILRKLIPAS